MDSSYSLRELEMMEIRLAEQELEILDLRRRIHRTESPALLNEAIRLIERIRGHYTHSSYYVPKEIRDDVEDFLDDVTFVSGEVES